MPYRAFISSKFLDDRASRGLPCGEPVTGEPVPRGTGKDFVELDGPTAAEMIDDAAYQGWFTDADKSIRNAAQAAFRDLVRHGVQYSNGVKYAGKLNRATPRDA